MCLRGQGRMHTEVVRLFQNLGQFGFLPGCIKLALFHERVEIEYLHV